MKNSTKLASAALLAAIGFGALAPQAVKADTTQSLTGQGKIEFTSASDTGSSDTTLPTGGSAAGSTDLPVDGSEGTVTSVGAFGVNYVSNLDFDKHTIVSSTANATETYWANTWVGNAGTANEMKQANFIKFKDTRSTLDHTYGISARITQQFTAKVGASATDVVLNGATITYSNPTLVPSVGTNASLAPQAQQATITADANTQVVTNNNTTAAAQFNNGYGEWSLLWGQYSATASDTSAKSVQLSIPRNDAQNTIIQEGTYNAQITWTMTDTPA